MNTTTNLSIKPEVLTPYEPIINGAGIYSKDFETRLTIKIGDASGTICLSCDIKNTDSIYNKIYGFEQVSKVINVDILDIIETYKNLIPTFSANRIQQIKNRHERYWNNSWVHKFIDVIRRLNIEGLSYSIPIKTDFIEKNLDEPTASMRIAISYKTKSTYVEKDVERGLEKWITPYAYEYGHHRAAKYSSPENLLKSFIKKVDEYLIKKNNETEKNNVRKERIKATIEKYTLLFGACVHEEKLERYKYGVNKFNEVFYDKYFIPLKDFSANNTVYHRKLLINEIANDRFSLGGIAYLSTEAVLKILDVVNND